MSSKLVKLPKPKRPTLFTIQPGYEVGQVAASLTVLVMVDNTVQLYGVCEPKAVALRMLQCGAERLEQWHQQQAKGSGLVGLDGLPLVSRPPEPDGVA